MLIARTGISITLYNSLLRMIEKEENRRDDREAAAHRGWRADKNAVDYYELYATPEVDND